MLSKQICELIRSGFVVSDCLWIYLFSPIALFWHSDHYEHVIVSKVPSTMSVILYEYTQENHSSLEYPYTLLLLSSKPVSYRQSPSPNLLGFLCMWGDGFDKVLLLSQLYSYLLLYAIGKISFYWHPWGWPFEPWCIHLSPDPCHII